MLLFICVVHCAEFAYAHFKIEITSQTDERWHVNNVSCKAYSSHNVTNWGFPKLITHEALLDPQRGYISPVERGRRDVVCRVTVKLVQGWDVNTWGLLDSCYDSKEATGMVRSGTRECWVGLRNLCVGMTFYCDAR